MATTTPNDPTSGADSAAQPFATLTPVNALARMAFSDVFDAMVLGRQRSEAGGNHSQLRMDVQHEQRYDADVARFRMDDERGRETSESLTEPDTDAEASSGGSLGMIWTGRYVFALEPEPSDPDLGWIVGKSAEQAPSADLLLSTKAFAKQYNIPLRTFHARFNFALDTGAFFATRITKSPHAELTVNGVLVERQMHTLNQNGMRIRISSLEYLFEYADFAATDEFFRSRRDYIFRKLRGPSTTPFDMPTPGHETSTMGQWTLSKPLGKGSEGRVFLASNARNEVVAIKVIERNIRTTHRVNAEIARYKEVTNLAKGGDDDDGTRLVCLKEIIYPGGDEKLSSGSPFDQVGLVMEPMTPATLDSIVKNSARG
jgi:hypothetical protein